MCFIFCRYAKKLDHFKLNVCNESKSFEHPLNFSVTSAECVHVVDLKEPELRPLMQRDQAMTKEL